MAKKYEDVVNSIEDNLKKLAPTEEIAKSETVETEVEVEVEEVIEEVAKSEETETEVEEVIEEVAKSEEVEVETEAEAEEVIEEVAKSEEVEVEVEVETEVEVEVEEVIEEVAKSEETETEVEEVIEEVTKSEALDVEPVEIMQATSKVGNSEVTEAFLETISKSFEALTETIVALRADITKLSEVKAVEETVSKSVTEPEGRGAVLPLQPERIVKSEAEIAEDAEAEEVIEPTFEEKVEGFFFERGLELEAQDLAVLRPMVQAIQNPRIGALDAETADRASRILNKYNK